MTTFLDALTEALRQAGAYNSAAQVAPEAILWPDAAREWERLVPRLAERLPLFTLGEYDPAARRGPSYWLRGVIAGKYQQLYRRGSGAAIPILYLPGVGREAFRDIAGSPQALKPLMVLQFSGVSWLQDNGKDWTVIAFLTSPKIGLGIEVQGTLATREALARALPVLADQQLEDIRTHAPLDEGYLDGLLVPDLDSALLAWLSDPDGWLARAGERWAALRSLLRREHKADPETEGPVTLAGRLGERKGRWATTWQRYTEIPQSYPGVAERLRAARPAVLLPEPRSSWPQVNEDAEEQLRAALLALKGQPPAMVRDAVTELERQHGERREWVWAKLGQAPLAQALGYLAVLAARTACDLTGATVAQLTAAYTDWGWQADEAAWRAVAAVSAAPDVNAVNAAVETLYARWLDRAAETLQQRVKTHGYQAGGPIAADNGTCLLFCDALRLDLGQRLRERLEKLGCTVTLAAHCAALPTVTATAKPAIMPIAAQLTGAGALGVNPRLRGKETDITAQALRELLQAAGYQVLLPDATGDPAGRGWTELGNLDELGHKAGRPFMAQLEPELAALAERVQALLAAGWREVVVLTDHGWLLLPNTPELTPLAEHLTLVRKGRFARLKPDATTYLQTVPWHWDEHALLALAPGAGCLVNEGSYQHGGISPQECFTPLLRVQAAAMPAAGVTIEGVSWRGLRCIVTLANGAGFTVDVRTKPGDADTSVAGGGCAAAADGRASLIVEDSDMEGAAAVVVVLSGTGQVLAQCHTTVGGD